MARVSNFQRVRTITGAQVPNPFVAGDQTHPQACYVLTAAVLINGEPVFARSAVNIGDTPDGLTRYKTDDGKIILHRRSDGAVVLAKKLLDLIEEPHQQKKSSPPS